MGTFTKTMKSLVIVILLFATVQVYAGAPTWTRVDYTSSTTFVGIVEINNPWTQSFVYKPVAGDYIGAFVGTECRMIAQIFSSGGNLYVSSVIQGGDTCVGDPSCTSAGKELVTFQLWSNANSLAYSPVKGDTTSNPGGNIGSTNPYVIGRPKTGKDLLTLTITGATLLPTFSSATTSYVDTVLTIPVSTAYTYTSSDRSTVSVVYATSLTGTLAQRTTTITVTAEDGTTKVYTIVYAPACTLTTVPTLSASAATICAGQTSTLSATGSGTAFTWYSDAAATKQLATGASYTVTPSATTTYYATQSNTVCSSPVGTLTVTVNPLPSVNAGANSAVCVNTGLTLSPTVTSGTSPFTYVWSPATNLSSTTVLSPTFNSASAVTATYAISLTDSKGCKTSSNITISVNAKPTVSVTPATATICKGATTSLTASGATTYLWSTAATTTGVTVTPAATTTYTVTGTANGCTGIATASVAVNALPTVTVSPATTSVCPGVSTILTASGANTYAWSTSGTGTTETVSPIATTTYTVTGTDNNNCTAKATATVSMNAGATVTITASSGTICAGASTVLTASGGNSYTWSTGGTTAAQTVSPTATTTYTVTGTTAAGCPGLATQTIVVNAKPTVSVTPATATICKGATTSLTASGATTYLWSTAATTTGVTVTPAATTTYTVTGTANGCTGIASASVAVNALPTVTVSPATTSVCPGVSTILTASGANTYSWSTSGTGTTETVSPIATTTYTVTGTDNNNCTAKATATVSMNAGATVTIAASSGTICAGASTVLTASGGNSYTWSTGGTTAAQTVSPTATLTYTVTGTTAAGCPGIATQTIVVNAKPTVSVSPATTTICKGASTSLTASGATTYLWSTAATTTGVIVTPAATTTYTVTGTANGCTGFTSASVTVNPIPTVSASMPGTGKYCINASAQTITFSPVVSAPATGSLSGTGVSGTFFTPSTAGVGTYTITYSYTDANGCTNSATTSASVIGLPTITASANPSTICYGNPTTISATGGTSYTWDNGVGVATSTTVSPLSTTTYNVTGTDANSCSNTSSIKVSVNSLPTITASVSTSPICSGSSTILTAKGGSTYNWSNGINNANNTVSPTVTTAYNVSGTDGNGCVNTASVSVTVNKSPTITASATNSVLCAGSSSTISAIGATTYIWNNGLPALSSNAVTPKTTTVYSVTGTDGNSCTGTSSISITVNALPSVSLVASSTTICNGSSTTLTAGGASTYVWDNSLSVGSNHIVSPTSSTTYNVTGTDGNSCTNTGTVSVNVTTVSPPIALNQSTIVNTTIPTLSATGGTSYKWYDSTGKNLLASTANFTPSISITVTGVYTYEVTNNVGGCESTPTTVILTVSNCATLAPSVSPTSQAACQGQAFTPFIASGTSIKWYDGSNNLLSSSASYTPTVAGTYYATQTSTGTTACESPKTNVTATTNALPNVSINPVLPVCANSNAITVIGSPTSGTFSGNGIGSNGVFNPSTQGNYSVTYSYTDVNGCANTATTSITVNAVPSVTVSAGSSAICAGSSTILTASGANSYSWDNGLSAGASNSITPSTSTTYNVTGTSNGCSAVASVSVTVNKLPTIAATVSPTSICYGFSSVISASGANSYSWNNGIGIANNKTVLPTTTTTYSVTGTDNNTCKNTTSVVVTVNQLPKVLLSLTPGSVCSGISTTITASGAATYSWDNGNGTGTIKTLYPTASTTYNVTGTDVNGCIATASTSVLVNQLPTVSVSLPGTGVYCANAKLQTITVSPVATGQAKGVLSGTAVTGSTFNPAATQTGIPYTITYTYTDANGCQNIATASATVNPLPIIGTNVASSSLCIGSSTTVSATGGVSYSWNNGLGSSAGGTVSPTATTIYSVTGTDVNGCTNTAISTITVHALPSVGLTASSSAICNGSSATLTASGANSYSWDNSLSSVASHSVSPITATTYNVIGTDANSCSNKASVTISVTTPTQPKATDKSVSVGAPDPTLTAIGTNITWYDSTGTAPLQTGSSFTPTVPTTTATIVHYKVTNTVNSCESSPITVTLTISSCTVSAPSVDKTTVVACSGAAFGTVTATGTTIKWYNAQGTLLSSTSAFTPPVAGDYYASQTNVCEGPKTKVTATTNALPVVSLPTVPALCANGTPYTVNPSPTGGVFSGTGVNQNGVFDPTIGSSTYVISYSYTDANKCSNSAKTTIVVNAVPIAPTINPVGILCGTSNVTLTQTGGVGVIWTNGTTAIDPSLTGLAPNTYTFYAQSNQNGCTSSLSSMTFTINPIPAAPVTTGDVVCQGENGTLTATGTGTIAWFDALDDNLANSKSISVSVAGAYYATQTINSCESPEAVANLVVNTKPAAVSIASQTINIGDAIPTFITTPQTVNWLDNNKGLISVGTTFTPSVSNTVAQTYSYFVDVTNATCTSNMSTFTLTIKGKNCPSSPYVNVPTACQGDNATITASGNNINWYNIEIGGTSLSNSNSYTTTVAGNYYATQTVNGCESPRTLADLVFNPKPAVSITAPSLMKTTDNPVVITVSPIGGLLSGDDIIGTKFFPSYSGAGDKIIAYTYNDQTTGCSATVQDTIIVIDSSINNSALITEIILAQNESQSAHDNNKIGNNIGQYPQIAVTTLNSAIDSAISVRNNTSATQAMVDVATAQITKAVAAFNNSIITGIDLSALNTLITSAQNLVGSAVAGTDVGDYPQSAIDNLKTAISAASAIASDKSSTQATVNSEVSTLQNAIDAFNLAQVQGVAATAMQFVSQYQTITIGNPQTLAYTLTPANSSVQLIWSSSDTSIAKVDQNGKVTVFAVGNVTITATSKNQEITASIIINAKTGISVITALNPVVYPTVTSDVLYVKNANGIKNIRIVSLLSTKTSVEAKTNADVIMLDVSSLPSGSYFVIMTTGEGSVITRQFIKD